MAAALRWVERQLTLGTLVLGGSSTSRGALDYKLSNGPAKGGPSAN